MVISISITMSASKQRLEWRRLRYATPHKTQYLPTSGAFLCCPHNLGQYTSCHAFETLYWCGLRLGEMLALTPADFDFERKIIHITKSFQRIKGEDIITPPKTEKGIRRVLMPDFYADKMWAYIKSLQFNENDRVFPFTKSYLHHEMRRGCAASGVKRIRIHGIRHSHISLLIDMGFSAVAIADRVGHESIDITYQ